MTAVSVTRGITRWDLNCYAGGSQAVSKRDLKRHDLGGVGMFSDCHSNIYRNSLYVKVSALNIHKITLIMVLKRGKTKKTKNTTGNYMTKDDTNLV